MTMEILGIIPARGGSKSIPQKNITILDGKPLIQYTIECIEQSKKLNRVILSTDDLEIANTVRKISERIEIPFLRPKEISDDTTPMIDVIIHTVNYLSQEINYSPDLIVLLQPTSPFRKPKHLDEAIDIFCSSSADVLVSVEEVPHRYSNKSQMIFIDNELKLIDESQILIRQEKTKYYARNGPSILILKPEILIHKNLYSGKIIPYFMDRISSIDIDDSFDLMLAKYIISMNLLK